MTVCEAQAGARLTIDTTALAANWRLCAARAPKAACAAAVKGDAYGIGIDIAVPALAEAGCVHFFVAHLAEAQRVRALTGAAAVYVLNGLMPGTAAAHAEFGLTPVLGSREELAEWQGFCTQTGWSGGAVLHVDTGMSRLGLTLEEALALDPATLPRLDLVMSHFACADEPEHPLNRRQIAEFAAVRTHLPAPPASLCNSSGLFLPGAPGLDMVRPGVALYGGNPTPGKPNPMRPVVTLEARILQLRDVAPGDSVGYGATWSSRTPTRLAVVAAGYGDGYLRAGSSSEDFDSAVAFVAGRPCPVAGRISMDLTAVDITALPREAVARGDWVELIGPHLTIDEVGRRAGTIGYEVLTSLGSRYHRRIA